MQCKSHARFLPTSPRQIRKDRKTKQKDLRSDRMATWKSWKVLFCSNFEARRQQRRGLWWLFWQLLPALLCLFVRLGFWVIVVTGEPHIFLHWNHICICMCNCNLHQFASKCFRLICLSQTSAFLTDAPISRIAPWLSCFECFNKNNFSGFEVVDTNQARWTEFYEWNVVFGIFHSFSFSEVGENLLAHQIEGWTAENQLRCHYDRHGLRSPDSRPIHLSDASWEWLSKVGGVWDAFGTERFNITRNMQKQRPWPSSPECQWMLSKEVHLGFELSGVDHKGSRKGQPYKEARMAFRCSSDVLNRILFECFLHLQTKGNALLFGFSIGVFPKIWFDLIRLCSLFIWPPKEELLELEFGDRSFTAEDGKRN